MKKVIRFGLVLLLVVLIVLQVTQFTNWFNRVSKGVYIVTDESGFYGFDVEDYDVKYRCRITLQNDTDQEKVVRIRAIQPAEFWFGSLRSPLMKVYTEDKQERSFSLAPHGKESYKVEFVAKLGWLRAFKMDRELPTIVVL